MDLGGRVFCSVRGKSILREEELFGKYNSIADVWGYLYQDMGYKLCFVGGLLVDFIGWIFFGN